MQRLQQRGSRSAISFFLLTVFFISLATGLVSCGGAVSNTSSTTTTTQSGTGTVRVTLTDPPSCMFPNGNFEHVYVTIRSVQANISATADDNASGWQELAPQLGSQPMQIDLFAGGTNSCLLTSLGSNTALPVGNYQQIRLLLVANNGGGGPLPVTNNCNGQGFNCVVLHDGSIHQLDLSSQANTGLKIPPGQIVGGPISVGAGQDVDLNIDFNACASIIQEGNGQYRLKPVLTAEQVSTNTTGISGHVIDATSKLPIVGGSAIVALEKKDSSGTDIIFEQTQADATGNFNFCPLPAGATFDVVVVAINGAGLAYNATIAVGVPGGTNLGAIPIIAETGLTPGPATFQGFVTATTGSTTATIDALVAAIQTVTVSGVNLPVTIPAEGNSKTNVSVESSTPCPASAPMHTNCAQFTLIEPASNPSVGTFSAGTISYSVPANGDVLYSIRASAFVPLGGGTSDCTPGSKTITVNSSGNPLKALPGSTITTMEVDFSGCS